MLLQQLLSKATFPDISKPIFAFIRVIQNCELGCRRFRVFIQIRFTSVQLDRRLNRVVYQELS